MTAWLEVAGCFENSIPGNEARDCLHTFRYATKRLGIIERDLEQKPDSGPRKCRMSRIILDCDFADIDEFANPNSNFVDKSLTTDDSPEFFLNFQPFCTQVACFALTKERTSFSTAIFSVR